MSEDNKERQNEPDSLIAKKKTNYYRPIIGIAVISLLICGAFFPVLITGIGQVLFPNQANGEIVQLHGLNVGSNLIDNNFSSPIFFHARNNSASGVDPDITLPDAYSQVPRISNATGISATELNDTINSNIEGTFWIFGSPYVNVLNLNLILIQNNPKVYSGYPLT